MFTTHRFAMRQARSRAGWVVAATAALGLGLMMTAPAASAATPEQLPNGFVQLVVPASANAIQLLIDVEAPGLTKENTVVTVDGKTVSAQRTALGATAVVGLTGQEVTVEVGVTRAVAADIAITLSDATGTALYEKQYRTQLTDYRDASVSSPTPTVSPTEAATTPAPSTPKPTSSADDPQPEPTLAPEPGLPAPTATSAAPASLNSPTSTPSAGASTKTGLLSSTGVDLGIVLPVALLAVLLGAVAVIVRKKVLS
jgi:hypothetical protein